MHLLFLGIISIHLHIIRLLLICLSALNFFLCVFTRWYCHTLCVFKLWRNAVLNLLCCCSFFYRCFIIMSKCSTPIVYKLLSCLFNFFLIQSPILVMHNSVTTRKTPGIRIIHQAPVSSAFSDSDSILPHEITSSGSPIPMKLNVDSSTIALRIFMTTINMMEDKKLGARCL